MSESQITNYETKLKNISEIPDLTNLISQSKENVEKEKEKLNKNISDAMNLINGVDNEIKNLKEKSQGEIDKLNTAINEASQKQEPILKDIKNMVSEMLNLDSFDKSLSDVSTKLNSVKNMINNEDVTTTETSPVTTTETSPVVSDSDTNSADEDNNDPFTNTGGETTMNKRNMLISDIKKEWSKFKATEKDITKWDAKTNQLAQRLKDFDEENKSNNGKYGPNDKTPDLKKYINELGGLKGGKKRKNKSKKTNKKRTSLKKIKKTRKIYSRKSKK